MNAAADGPKPIVYAAGEGKIIEIGTVRLTFKATGEQTGGAYALIEVTIPPHFAGPLPHIHKQTTEAYFVLQGTLAFTLGEETIVVRQGGYVLVPPATVHTYWNPAATPATCLTLRTPAGFERYFEALAKLMENETSWPPADMSKVAALGMQFDQYPAGE